MKKRIKASKGFAYYDKETGQLFPWAMETKDLDYHLIAAEETKRVKEKKSERYEAWMRNCELVPIKITPLFKKKK